MTTQVALARRLPIINPVDDPDDLGEEQACTAMPVQRDKLNTLLELAYNPLMVSSRRWASRLVLPAILLLAAAFRLYRLLDFPPGFHFDEAIDLKIALDVAHGARPLYVPEGWGREGLYYYLVAPLLRVIDYNPLALRLAAVICGLGVLVAAYGLARRWHGQLAGWLTAAWLAVAMWPVWAARFGVRHISLALMLGLAAWAFWQAFGELGIRNDELGIRNEEGARDAASAPNPYPLSPIPFFLAGLLLGLTAYTYQPARFVPLLFGGFGVYLALFHRRWPWSYRRGWLVWGLTAVLVALPLVVILTQATPIETGERAFSIEPLTELLAGNPRPLLDNAVALAGVFTAAGDPLKSYNLPGRPLFVPRWTGVFFYAGLALALWRWRRPPYAFALLWLAVGLLGSLVTISAPNFNRMVAAQFPVFFLAGAAAAEAIGWAGRRARWAGAAVALLVVVALGWTARDTARDLFHVWPEQFADAHPLNREIAAVARYLETSDDPRPVVISSRDIEDEDPYVVSVSLDRAVERRWVDTSQALALPVGAAEARLFVTADRWIDPALLEWVGEDAPTAEATTAVDTRPAAAGWWASLGSRLWALVQSPLDETHLPFARHVLRADEWPTLATPALSLPPESGAAGITYPVPFCACAPGDDPAPALSLLGARPGAARPGEELTLLTTWETGGARFVSLAMFVHLLDSAGAIVAQDDGLGYPPHTWQPGDRFVQVARLPLPPDLPPGDYTLQFGLYDRADGRRWPVLAADGQPSADRLLLPVRVGE